ncbi:tryptophan--tRNA ligase [Baekduia soli]|uniref:Tryptophan--tRNA ligase n=1 Tax=Baekduia soli TaxID=496014 RepID=A0A5B8U6S9_9ACTN|nr:tryptophan--tRNA ligase [Baekduia soli]QEC48615.1 tryptophan--tRNA ligase [Baekduia soli]
MRIFSGIQPTGRKHLGNYIGAIVQYVEGQHRAAEHGDVGIFCVVDLHAMTVAYDPAEMRARVYDTAAILLAAGLDPERCIFFRQSDVPEHTELAWHLGAITSHGDLNRMHQFKEKSARQRDLVSADLFFYPVLMAADVLAYRAHEVPVGDDQRQHVELMRDLAQRFNARFGDELVVPELLVPATGARIMDLQAPDSKMSTTGGTAEGTVYVLDDAKTVEKKFKRAVTDSDDPPRIVRDPAKPGVTNLIDILAAASGRTHADVEAEMASARGYGDLKLATAAAVNALLDPVRERYAQLRPDEDALEAVLGAGAQKARAIASETLVDVRRVMGVGPRP